MIGFRIGKAVAGSARVTLRAGLIAAAFALVSGEAVAIECPPGWVQGSTPTGSACRKNYGVGTPQTGQSRAPAKSAPALCSANLVARYLTEVARQPPARRPAPGSVVALTENGKACVMQMPVAAAPPPQRALAQPAAPPQRVIVRGPDGKYRIMTLAEAVAAAGSPPQFGVPSLAGEFSNLASTPLLIGPPMQSYVDGQLVFAPLPNAPPGYKTKFDLAFDWAEARVIAEANWARENKAEAAIAALSMAVSMALPELPAVAALGSLGSTLVAGLTAPLLATSTTSFINKLASTGRTDMAFVTAAKDAGLLVLKALPSAFGGELFTTVSTEIGAPALVTSLAEKAGSAGGDLAAQYGQSIMTQPIPVNYQSTVSLKPQAAR